MLVDGGGVADNAVFDVGRLIVAPFLRYQKIRTLDLVVLTHADADHLNGLLYVLDTFPVEAFWSNREAADTLGYRLLTETVARQVAEGRPGDSATCRASGLSEMPGWNCSIRRRTFWRRLPSNPGAAATTVQWWCASVPPDDRSC